MNINTPLKNGRILITRAENQKRIENYKKRVALSFVISTRHPRKTIAEMPEKI